MQQKKVIGCCPAISTDFTGRRIAVDAAFDDRCQPDCTALSFVRWYSIDGWAGHPAGIIRAEPLPCCGECSPERDTMELQLLELAFQQDLPVLGICRGLQLLNVCFGGTLYQDLPEQVSSSISHHQTPPYDQPVHTVSVLPETPLAALLEQETLAVNSYHHQGILKLAEALQPMAVAPDGLIESVWLPEKAFVWGVQWHPEYDYQKNVASQQIFQAFVQAAYKQKK